MEKRSQARRSKVKYSALLRMAGPPTCGRTEFDTSSVGAKTELISLVLAVCVRLGLSENKVNLNLGRDSDNNRRHLIWSRAENRQSKEIPSHKILISICRFSPVEERRDWSSE
jgi:hypothetical protein